MREFFILLKGQTPQKRKTLRWETRAFLLLSKKLVEAVKSVSKMCEIKRVCVQYVQTDKEKIWFNEILVKLKMKETRVEIVSGNLRDNK